MCILYYHFKECTRCVPAECTWRMPEYLMGNIWLCIKKIWQNISEFDHWHGLVPGQRYKRRHRRWLTNRLLQSSGGCFPPLISLRLLAQVCRVQTGPYDGSQGFVATHWYCVSVRELLASEGVCFLTRSGLLLNVTPLGVRSWEEAPLG